MAVGRQDGGMVYLRYAQEQHGVLDRRVWAPESLLTVPARIGGYYWLEVRRNVVIQAKRHRIKKNGGVPFGVRSGVFGGTPQKRGHKEMKRPHLMQEGADMFLDERGYVPKFLLLPRAAL